MVQEAKQWTPQGVEWSTDVVTLMPAYRDLPDEFTRDRSLYCDLVSKWFLKA